MRSGRCALSHYSIRRLFTSEMKSNDGIPDAPDTRFIASRRDGRLDIGARDHAARSAIGRYD